MKLLSENPYTYTKKDFMTITDARIAIKQGYDEGCEAQLASCEAELKAERERIIKKIDRLKKPHNTNMHGLTLSFDEVEFLKERIREGV